MSRRFIVLSVATFATAAVSRDALAQRQRALAPTVCKDSTVVVTSGTQPCATRGGIDLSATSRYRQRIHQPQKTPSGLPVSVSSPGSDTLLVSRTLTQRLRAKKTVEIELSFTSSISAGSCHVDNPGGPLATIYVATPGSAEQKLLSILADDVYPGGVCLGNHSIALKAAIEANPHDVFNVRFTGYAVNFHGPLGMLIVGYPTVKISGDADPQINRSYQIGAGAGSVADAWRITAVP